MLLPVTLATAAAAAFVNLWLSLRITRGRLRDKVSMGDGGQPLMISRMRSHANFAENAPLVLILIAAIELVRGGSVWLWLAGAVFVVARLMHPLGMDRPSPNPLRAGGAMLTWTVLGVLAIWAAVIAIEGAGPEPAGTVPAVVIAPA